MKDFKFFIQILFLTLMPFLVIFLFFSYEYLKLDHAWFSFLKFIFHIIIKFFTEYQLDLNFYATAKLKFC